MSKPYQKNLICVKWFDKYVMGDVNAHNKKRNI